MRFITKESLNQKLIDSGQELYRSTYYEAKLKIHNLPTYLENDEVFIKIENGFLIPETLFDFPEAGEYFMTRKSSKEPEYDGNKIIVTRHDVLAEFIRKELGVKARRVNYARIYEIQGKDVYGVIPIAFMGEVRSLTTVHHKISDDRKLKYMSLEDYKDGVIDVRRYTVEYERVGDWYHRWIERR